MAVYGVDKEVSSYASLFKRWGGGKWSVKIRSKTIRGFLLDVEHLPVPELKEDLTEFEYISKDGTTCCRYLLLLAETCQVSIENFLWMQLLFPRQ